MVVDAEGTSSSVAVEFGDGDVGFEMMLLFAGVGQWYWWEKMVGWEMSTLTMDSKTSFLSTSVNVMVLGPW